MYCVLTPTLKSTLTSFICATGSSIQSDWSCRHYLHKRRTPENTSQVPQQGPVHFEVWFDRHKSRQLGAKAHRPASTWRVISIPFMITSVFVPLVTPSSVFVQHLAPTRSMAHPLLCQVSPIVLQAEVGLFWELLFSWIVKIVIVAMLRLADPGFRIG